MYLWNERVMLRGWTQERIDSILASFRKLGWRMFMKGLRKDCYSYMVETHGENWTTKPRKTKGGYPTAVGKDQHAIVNMIWNSAHTDWFKYKAGSRLFYLRFPFRYRKIARDGEPAFF